MLTTDTVDAHLVWRRGRAEGALGAGVAHLALFDHDAATVRELDGGGTYTLSRRWTLKATLLAAQDDRPGRHTAYAGTLRAVFGLATQTTLALGGTLCLHGTPLTGVPPAPLAAAVTVLGLDNAVGDFHDGTLGLFSLSARVAW